MYDPYGGGGMPGYSDALEYQAPQQDDPTKRFQLQPYGSRAKTQDAFSDALGNPTMAASQNAMNQSQANRGSSGQIVNSILQALFSGGGG